MFETLSKGFRAAKNRLAGVSEITAENIEPALRDVRLSLLEADVEFSVTKRFLERVKAKAIGDTIQRTAEVGGRKIKIGPVEQFVKICQDELEAMMAFEGEAITFEDKGITGIMMVGLQGSGKTTSAAKLARLMEAEHGRKVLLVAADVARPGAIEQLQVLGEQISVPVFAIQGGDHVDICEQAYKHCKRIKRDTIIYDTAGRLAVDEPLMQELDNIRDKCEPKNTFLVVDAMIGQNAVTTAKVFHERVGVTGIVLTKMDGDARGGAALSIREVTGAPVKFVGLGETMDKMEQFRPDGMASRILGMGDVVGLMKDFQGVVDEEKAEQDAKRMLQGDFTLDDFLEQISMLQNMGPLKDIFEKLPMFGDAMPEGLNIDESELDRTKAMVSSMTKQERKDPSLFQKQASRINRVAKGSGREAKEVADLLQRFAFMRNMMGNIGQQAGMLGKIPGMKQIAQARRMRNVVKTGGLEGNPMMAGLADQLLEAAIAEGGAPGGMGGMGGLAGMLGQTQAAPSAVRRVDRNKKKSKRKMQKKSRRKGRK